MNRDNMDPFCLDPIDPPEGATAAEVMLWRGLCPWCGTKGPFAPADPQDESLVCRGCGLEFEGPVNDQAGGRPRRVVEAIFKRGDPGKRGGRPDDLPAVTERPRREHQK